MSKRKLKWMTVDDQPTSQKCEFDEPLNAMQFQQQRIRTFQIRYELEDMKFLQ
jgi:hypothetical protein